MAKLQGIDLNGKSLAAFLSRKTVNVGMRRSDSDNIKHLAYGLFFARNGTLKIKTDTGIIYSTDMSDISSVSGTAYSHYSVILKSTANPF